MFLKGTNSNHDNKLILTVLLREVIEEEIMYDSLHCWEELKDNIHLLNLNSYSCKLSKKYYAEVMHPIVPLTRTEVPTNYE
jgi:hypothetical protein